MNIQESGGTFLGVLEKKESAQGRVFYNFFLKGKFDAGGLRLLSASAIEELFFGAAPIGRNLWFPTRNQQYEGFLDTFLERTLILEIAPQETVFSVNDGNLRTYKLDEPVVRRSLRAVPAITDGGATLAQLQEELSEAESALNICREEVRTLSVQNAEQRAERDRLKAETARLSQEREALDAALAAMKESLTAYVSDAAQSPWAAIGRLSLDGQLTSQMLQAASAWQEAQKAPAVRKYPALEPVAGRELAQAICRSVQAFRPSYSPLDILNIAVCLTQGFLTVFYGGPGCGKTSICGIFAYVLGLEASERYVPVSVERGWMSKRDFIGYFNPLTKTFDSSNRKVYDALRLLDGEPGGVDRPFVILLDEANLSSMEYYWADFMNLCEDGLIQGQKVPARQIRGAVNLGEDQLEVPDSLRFIATINTDHTTETLSPRLIDRAWMISLPSVKALAETDMDRVKAEHPPVVASRTAMAETFGGGSEEWLAEPQRKFAEIIRCLQEDCKVSVSYRVQRAVRRYWAGARRAFAYVWPENTHYTDADTAALDYAVAQRVLPQLQGSGPDFLDKLDKLENICNNCGLSQSAGVVRQVRERGKHTEYFQLF